MAENYPALVSTQWLADHLHAPDVRVVDASWHMPDQGRDARAEYNEAHIPGAVFLDLDDVCDTDIDLPHMLPSPEKLSSRLRKLGLGDGMRIVIYDNSDVKSAARAWFMLRCFGHRDVAVLDGGFQKWRAENRPTEDIPPIPGPRHFTARFNNTMVRDLDQMLANLHTRREQVIDARGEPRFKGSVPEPRPNMKSGHIPDSLNIPYTTLLDPKDGTYRPAEDLKKIFQEAGVDLKKPVVTSCGSGITACVLALGLHLVGHQEVAVYDGSWAEWGSHPDTPVEK
ncbi:3-mercaptopyruvate sulfurtransferase [Luteithermobacter gelatinilyticus]|uniref:3-mercaptopyruvate sulfurtransferase n=1 Tax=Luteithermobacter gelatinilyticus TaxID=2582913 RepID=UPI00110748DE|nr:3-mercaptopyruvate sulfurtransferase [Luteithermobacter gelatinilyticus]